MTGEKPGVTSGSNVKGQECQDEGLRMESSSSNKEDEESGSESGSEDGESTSKGLFCFFIKNFLPTCK